MKKIIALASVTLLTVIVLLTSVFAWFMNVETVGIVVSGTSTDGYYAGGTGKKDDPYIIARPKHLYNLAWLQDLGFYDNSKTYFKLANSIDMDGLTIPPIGIDDIGYSLSSSYSSQTHPFIGEFDGNGYAIKNVNISTLTLSNRPDLVTDLAAFKFGTSIGLFGSLESRTIGSEKIVGRCANFFLDAVKIEGISGAQTIGLIAGNANGDLESIGVAFSELQLPTGATNLDSLYNISAYTLVGSYNQDNINWESKPTGGVSQGFGGSMNVKSVYDRMRYISKNSWTFPSVTFDATASGGSYPNVGSYLPLVVSNEISDDYYSKNTSEQININNIGYFTGSNNSVKIIGKKIKDKIQSSDLVRENNMYTDFNCWTSFSNTSGDKSLVTLKESVKSDMLDLLNSTDGMMYTIRLSSQVDVNNGVTVKNAVVAGKSYTSNSYLPARAVWFVPQEAGMIRIIISTFEGNAAGFSIYRITRNSNKADADNPYSASISSIQAIDQLRDGDGNIVYDANWTRELDANRLYQFEIPSEAGIEYALGNQNGSGPHLMYIDIGQNGDSSTGTKSGTIEKIDFVYYDDTSSTGYSSLDDPSNVAFAISDTATSTCVIQIQRNKANGVVYYIDLYGVSILPFGEGVSVQTPNKIKN